MPQKMGRPKSDNPMNERLYVRVTKDEKEEIMKIASEYGCSVLDLVRLGIEKITGQKK